MSGVRIAPLVRLPLAIGAMASLFLGLFLLYPLWGVLSASFLTPDGTAFTLDNYVKVLSRASTAPAWPIRSPSACWRR